MFLFFVDSEGRVLRVRESSVCRMFAEDVCAGCFCRMFAQDVFAGCLYRMFVQSVCTGCLHRMFAPGVVQGTFLYGELIYRGTCAVP